MILGKVSKKKTFFWEISPKCGWVGWLTPKQGPNPSKKNQIAPKIAFFDPNFTFRSPKSHKNPGVGGWVNRFGKGFPKKTVFFLAASLNTFSFNCKITIKAFHSSKSDFIFFRTTSTIFAKEKPKTKSRKTQKEREGR